MAFIKTSANGNLQLFSLILAFISTGMIIYIICSDRWAMSDIEGTVLEAVRRGNGLFYKCSLTFSDGKDACEDYDTFFVSLPPAILGSRILVSVGLFFGVLGTIFILLGGSFTSFMAEESDEKTTSFLWIATPTKAKVAIGGGICMLLSFALNFTATLWFALLIVNNYTSQSALLGNGNDTTGIRLVWGPAIWIGFVGSLTALVSGLLVMCGSCRAAVDDGAEGDEYYKPGNEYGNINARAEGGIEYL